MWIVRLALSRPYTFVVVAMLIAVMGASVHLIKALGGGWEGLD